MVWKPTEDPLSKWAKAMALSTQQAWLSSLSVALKAQQELGQHFSEMMRLGGQEAAPAKVADADAEAPRLPQGDSVQAYAERAFETRLVPLLQRGDATSREEIERLTREVEELTRRVEALCREREDSDY